MSMICWIIGLKPAQMAALRTTPSLVRGLVVVAQDDRPKPNFDEAIKRISPEQWKRFEAYQAALEPRERKPQPATAEARKQLATLGPLERPLNLDKSWLILHYLFTGHVGPANAAGE